MAIVNTAETPIVPLIAARQVHPFILLANDGPGMSWPLSVQIDACERMTWPQTTTNAEALERSGKLTRFLRGLGPSKII